MPCPDYLMHQAERRNGGKKFNAEKEGKLTAWKLLVSTTLSHILGECFTCRHEMLGGVEAPYTHTDSLHLGLNQNGMWTSCGRSEEDVIREEGAGVSFSLYDPCRFINHAATETHHSSPDNLGIIYIYEQYILHSDFLNCNDNELYSQARSFWEAMHQWFYVLCYA